MAGKSNKGKNRKGSQTAPMSGEPAVSSDISLIGHSNGNDIPAASESSFTKSEVLEIGIAATESNAQGVTDTIVNNSVQGDMDTTTDNEVNQDEVHAAMELKPKQGDIHLYPVTVKTQSGEKIDLQLSPGDSVMDVRQFLLDASETCFFTCYDLLLHTKNGSVHHLEDYNDISEVADITAGDCFLEMVAAFYDDRSIRAHVHRIRDLLSLSSLHSSLSTSLALQHDKKRRASDPLKTEVTDLDSLDFMENVSSSLSSLFLPRLEEKRCVGSIVFSSFNPPPSYRRLSGDLIYLDVVTLEGNKYCITGTTTGFYVNSSIGDILDAKKNKSAYESTTLVGLLQKISSKFKKAFQEVLEVKASAHPFENVQSLLPPNSWLGLYPVPDHKRDAARAENTLTLSFGSELIGMQRDWNEELQSCREFPQSTAQERVSRDRALYKVTSDFVDAAINGAVGVIGRCIPPINPTDPECFHMYVHNSIFFSFAVDADLELSWKQSSDANSKLESIGSAHNSSEKIDSHLHGVHRISGTVDASRVQITNGAVDSATDGPAEPQFPENEQATYASANNDLKGTRAYQEVDVPGLFNLAMAIIDYRGHRVVAQSVLPGILQGDKSDSLLYGSVDNGKKICWNEEFHSKVLEAAKRLRLKEHSVIDGSGNIFKLAAPVECKGIVGSDDRHYLLDLMRVTPRDANYTGPNSRFCILRPELITSFCHVQASEVSKSQCRSESQVPVTTHTSNIDHAEPVVHNDDSAALVSSEGKILVQGENGSPEECVPLSENEDTRHDILFNPNVFTDFKLAGSLEEIATDEESVRKASLYLKDVVLKKFIEDLCKLEVSPMDGQTLTEALHANGINVRYIGKVAEGTRHMPHLWDLCLNEIIVRSAKHILKDMLRATEDHVLGTAISHFLNCLFGDITNEGVLNGTKSRNQKKSLQDNLGHQTSLKALKGQSKLKSRGSDRKKHSLYASDCLWSEIQEFARFKYQFVLPDDARVRIKKIPVIRNLCQKVGIMIAARKYDLNSMAPFESSDILDLQPVSKHAIPISSEAKDLVETGKAQLAEGMLGEAYTLFSEAFTILQQVTGPMHREVANCCRYLAMVLYHAGDMAGAIIQQHKELIINEHFLGLDHPDTAHSYGNMALFYHGLNQTELALQHMARAVLLLSLSSGPDHPDVAATFINVAMMYQDFGKIDTALRYLQEALKKNERLLGKEHIQTAVCYHALAIAFNCMGAYKLSQQHEKKTYDILVKQLGEEDSRTRDSENWMKTFKMRELQVNVQRQKVQSMDAASAQKAIDMLKAAVGSGASGNSSSSANKSLNATVLGEALPRGRGVDERAARATAEVRKKAAAKGLLIRPHSVPVQAFPSNISQILTMLNSGMAPDAVNAVENGDIPTISQDAPVSEPEPKSGQEDETPVGLGTGLKQKSKPKSS